MEKFVVVDGFEVKPEPASIKLSGDIRLGDGKAVSIWYKVSGISEDASFDCADAFFGPSLLLALKHGIDLLLKVPISESLAEKAEDIAFVAGTVLGLDRTPRIILEDVRMTNRRAQGAVAGFSSGVDSWFTLKKNLIECTHPSRRLTHLLFNDVGANSTRQRTQEARRRAEEIADEVGLGLLRVDSNMARVLHMDFQQTHTVRNASVAHLLTPVADLFYYSSGHTYLKAGVFPAADISYADAVLLPLLSSDAIELRSSGSCFTRGEKTREILDISRIGERLDVCVRHERISAKINCGRCWKCLRTAVMLEALGALEQFEPVFDMAAYRKYRAVFLQAAAASRMPIEREAFDMARKAGLVGPRILYMPGGAAVNAVRATKIWRSLRWSARTKPGPHAS